MKLSGQATEACNATCGATIGNLSYVHTCNNISGVTPRPTSTLTRCVMRYDFKHS